MKKGQILVHVEPGKVSENRLRYALSMAQAREQKLIGLTVRLSPAAALSAAISDAQAVAALCEASGECCVTAQEQFASVTKGSGIAVEWCEATGIAAEVVAAEAARADIVVLGRNDYDDPEGGVYSLAAADVILACGTPVLTVSAQAPLSFRARRILLAWKSTPQAARAVRDALPFLQRAEAVQLTEIVAHTNSEKYEIPAQSVADYLQSHGVTVSVSRVAADGDPADQLMQAAADAECDLIVAGAYGHSRFHEWALGGVTRALLTAPTLPCIFSH